MKVSEFIEEVRRQTGDTKTDYRVKDPQIILYINACIKVLKTDHPECTYVDDVTIGYPADVAAVTEDLPIHDSFFSMLMHFVCQRIFMEDAEATGNEKKANAHTKLGVARK